MKTWLITGTSSGFGRALATKLAKAGKVKLIATARKQTDLTYLDQYDHGQIKKLIVDVAKPDEIKAAVKEALAFSPEIDVLVNNAGLGYFATIEESDLEEVRYMFEVNFFGLAEMTKELLPIFRQQRSGVIVNISSALGLTTLPTMGYYSATKFAVEGYSDALRQEVANLGIKVLTVEPSGARTNWAGSSSEKTAAKIADYQQFEQSIEETPDQVTAAPGNPDLIAQAIIDVVNGDENINHLPLGQFAYEGSLDKLSKLEDEIKRHQQLSLSTDDK